MKKTNLSEHNKTTIPSAKNYNFGIVVAEWNAEITGVLYKGAYETLIENGAEPENIHTIKVPGAFELTSGARVFAKNKEIDSVIVLGCVIQGETRHFDFICNGVTQGITQLNLDYDKSFIFGLLTPNNFQQAKDRAGGKHGNKGVEAAVTALKMISLL